MSSKIKAAFWHVCLLTASTVLAFVVIAQCDAVSRFSYLVEKGKIQAARESLNGDDDLDRWNGRMRAVANTVKPAVVQIVTERTALITTDSRMSFLRELFDIGTSGAPQQGEQEENAGEAGGDSTVSPDSLNEPRPTTQEVPLPAGYGSGFIFDAENGHIVTNSHVIDGCDSIQVHLADGRRFPAEVVGVDKKTDLAVIQIQADNLHSLPIADSDKVEVGDDVMAVGNPFGLEGTFSRGIVSAKNRSSVNIHGAEYRGFLQTDAVINPGNSGGPLVNMRGEVIAVNTAIATESGHYDGVGFAIPSARVMLVVPTLIRGEQILRGYLGISMVGVTENQARADSLGWQEYYGVIVQRVLPDSPAAEVLSEDDIILEIDGKRIRGTADLIDMIGETEPGVELALRVWRDSTEHAMPVRVAAQPKNFSTRIPIHR